jgi:replicative DNA helicase
MEKVELLILKNLIYNEDFVRKILPYLKCEYFQDYSQKVVFEEIQEFFSSYNQLPTKEAIEIEIENRTDLTEESFKNCLAITTSLEYEPVEDEWLFSTTEKWCKDRAIYLALMESIQIADGGDSKRNRDAIPSILQEALSVSFDTHIGHDYIEDVEARYEFYHKKDLKISFDIDYLNRITGGGLSPKTLNLVVAAPGVGKSLFLCHFASSILFQGKNVLYFTLEMAEERIAERIDANLLDVSVQDLSKLSKEKFLSKATQLSRKTQGKLIIKEYPPGAANANHFKALLKELELKKNFVPDVIIVDYLNLCSSSRLKTSNANSYSYVKSIAEELRAIGVEHNIPIFSATQFNRCLAIDTNVTLKNGNKIEIKNINVGDEITSHSGNVKVEYVYPIETQEVYEIVTKSGKKIICSDKHIFPTTNGEKNILNGLTIGDKLYVKK